METLIRKQKMELPVRAVQFGEGNFLRAFIDWMIDRMNKAGVFNGCVRLIQPRSLQGMAEKINAQGGLYHVIRRGVQNGKVMEEIDLVESVECCLKAATEWDKAEETARIPTLRFVFSNTTEAGIEYKPGVDTFPSKVARFAEARCKAGLPGLVFIPCELIERNGEKLRECTLRYVEDPQVRRWIETECVFCNTLVDRIVAGYPRDAAPAYWEKLGVRDELLDCCEPFFFFVIEGPDEIRKELPAPEAGLNVLFTRDQTPYRTRKVRFLNGAHTASVLGAHMAGFTFVDEMVRDEKFGRFLRTVLFEEVMPTIDLPETEKQAYAESVLERFANPYANHRLLSIALNSVSKWKVRVLPTLLDYRKRKGRLPDCLTQSMAYLIDFYRTCEINDAPGVREFFESKPSVEAILANTAFWDMDLNTIPGFTEQVKARVTR